MEYNEKNQNECMDWDAELTDDGQERERLILPEGNYVFQVVNLERGRHPGSAKLPPCNKASVTLEITTAEGVARVKTDLYLHMSTEWKISAFFRAIGLKEKGQHVRMDWTKVPEAWGRAHIRPRTYVGSDEKEHVTNEVAWFLDFDPELVKPGFITVDEEAPF